MLRPTCLSVLTISVAAACGSVSNNPDGGMQGSGDGPPPANCEFAAIGSACAFPPHVPIDALRTCLGAAGAPALAPPTGATLTFRKSGAAYQLDCSPDCGGGATTIAAQEALFQVGAPLVELFCLKSAALPGGVTVRADPSFDRAIALLAAGDITVGGTIDLSGAEAVDVPGGTGGPGGYAGGGRVAPFDGGGPCGGRGGLPQTGNSTTGAGGGGGGLAGSGGIGGAGNPAPAGAAGGCNKGYAKLEGGSGGGAGGLGLVIANGGTNFGSNFAGSGGGGALALLSKTSVTVAATGTILANGAKGHIRTNNASFNYNGLGGTGGGAGGMIVLVAPAVNVTGSLRALGGDGAVAWGAGGAGAQGASLNGGNGGNGPASTNGGAGGGGAGGYIRIFSGAGTAECSAIASPMGSCATGRVPEMPATP